MRKSRKYLVGFIILVILLLAAFAVLRVEDGLKTVSSPPAQTYETVLPTETAASVAEELVAEEPAVEEPVAEKKTVLEENLPLEVDLKIPFTSQSPHQNWDLPYQEFCEEASILMAMSYVNKEPILGPDDADAKLLAINNFEEKKLGFYKDTSAKETAKIIKEFYAWEKVATLDNPTAEDIKKVLASGKVVIAPFAGRELGNPNYRQPGPLYHMLVIKGYQKNGNFITNDPGTRKGAGYIYKEKVIMDAIHDWNDGDVVNGKKVIIIVG